MPSTPEKRRAHATEIASRAGCRMLSRSRVSGALIGLFHGAEAHLCTAGGVWVTLCEDHTYVCNHDDYATARYWLARPHVWCPDCAAELDRRVATRRAATRPTASTKRRYRRRREHARETFGRFSAMDQVRRLLDT
jgi:hypothetical protein